MNTRQHEIYVITLWRVYMFTKLVFYEVPRKYGHFYLHISPRYIEYCIKYRVPC